MRRIRGFTMVEVLLAMALGGLVLAAASEVVWRHFTTDQWVTVKAFGIPIAAVVFSVALSPILRRQAAEPEE